MMNKMIARSLALAAFAGMAMLGWSETYAVLMGVNDYPNPTDASGSPLKDEQGKPVEAKLKGCVNDVNDIGTFLTELYGIDEKNVIKLTDKAADSKAFLDTMKSTIAKLKPGDQLIYFFSGHGTRIKDDKSKDDDGKASAIVLADMVLVRGNLFGDLSKALAGAGIHSTYIFDSCFSGGMSRDVNIYGINGARKKSLNFSAKQMKDGSGLFKAAIKDYKGKVAGQPKMMDEKGQYAFFFASQNNVTSIDFPGTDDGKIPPHGLFTLGLLAHLVDKPEAPSSEVSDNVLKWFNTQLEKTDIKQRPTTEFSSPERAKQPVFPAG